VLLDNIRWKPFSGVITVLKYGPCGRICVCSGRIVLRIICGFGPIYGLCIVCGLCGSVYGIYYIKAKKTRLIYGI
jgi:hypothetical protein